MRLQGVTGRERLLVVLTAGVILGALVLTTVVEPQLRQRRARRVELNELHLQLAGMRRDMLVKNRIDKAYSQVAPLIAGGGNDQQEISVFTRELGDLYAKLNIKTRSVKILPTQHEEYYRLLSIRVEVEGPVREMIRFVLAVESHPKPLRIEQLTLKAQEVVDDVYASFLLTKVVAGPTG